MKLTFEAEDAIVGALCGLLIVGYTERYFSLKLPDFLYIAAFAIFIAFILLDVIYEFSDFTNLGFMLFSLVHNLIDFVISISIISHFAKWNLPYISSLIVPYLQDPNIMFGIGAFLFVGNVIWLFIFPFAS